jgi:flagellar hook-length control protein FliK
LKLQVKATPAPPDTPAAKPALTELLHQPKPEVETPTILAPTASTEGTPAVAPSQTSQAAQVAQAVLPAPAHATPLATGAEAALAAVAPGAVSAVRVAATTASAETPLPAAHPSLVGQVDGSIRWLLKNQEPGAELQLHPESLGTVQIKLRMEGTEVHARVWASDPSALPVLQQHRAFLEASLRDQGLSLGSFDLRQGRQGQETPVPTEPSGTATALAGALESGQETPIAPPPSLLNHHRIEIVA